MANRKISDLTALTAPATGDLLPIVDISEAAAADKNKKITFGELFASIPLGTAAAPSVAFEGDPNTGIYSPGADTLAFVIGGVEAMRIDSSGRVGIGTSTTRFAGSGSGIDWLVEGAPSPSNIGAIRNSNNAFPARIVIAKTRGASVASNTVVQSGDSLGLLEFDGADGTGLIQGAGIEAFVDGTPGTNDLPTRLVFSTTANGAASSTEAMRIKSTQIINFSNAPTHADNTAATAAGLAVGDVYKTVLGVLMIRF
jgi:hypothetical protein